MSEPPADIFKLKERQFEAPSKLEIDRDEYPEGGGSFRYFKGKIFPLKGCPYREVIMALKIVKGIVRPALGILKRNKGLIFMVLMLPRLRKSIVEEMAEYVDRILMNYYLESKRYCLSGQELRRVAYRFFFGQTAERVIEFGSLVWEYDLPYRWRAQDILPRMDRNALIKNPTSEVYRLWALLISREIAKPGTYLPENWKGLRTLFYWGMKLNKKFRNRVRDFLLEVDMEKIKLDLADLHYCFNDIHYNFREGQG